MHNDKDIIRKHRQKRDKDSVVEALIFSLSCRLRYTNLTHRAVFSSINITESMLKYTPEIRNFIISSNDQTTNVLANAVLGGSKRFEL